MNLRQTFATAFVALRRNVTRSLLTMLGIVIGIASVITTLWTGFFSLFAIVRASCD